MYIIIDLNVILNENLFECWNSHGDKYAHEWIVRDVHCANSHFYIRCILDKFSPEINSCWTPLVEGYRLSCSLIHDSRRLYAAKSATIHQFGGGNCLFIFERINPQAGTKSSLNNFIRSFIQNRGFRMADWYKKNQTKNIWSGKKEMVTRGEKKIAGNFLFECMKVIYFCVSL